MKINEVSHILDKPLLSGDAEQRISAVVADSRSVLFGAVLFVFQELSLMGMNY